MGGFASGIVGIWFVTRSSPTASHERRRGLWLAITAGVGFGGFFVLIALVEPGSVFAPLLVSKVVALLVALTVLTKQGLRIPSPRNSPRSIVAGALDSGGNVFYLLAIQFTRFDVAAVLSSMYPTATVILASRLLKENISKAQWFGVMLCVLAIGLIVR